MVCRHKHLRHVVQATLGLFALILLLSGCQPQETPQSEEFSIKIDSPASGMSTSTEQVTIQSTATGPNGVSWIELWVDGELVETAQAPTPLQPKFSTVQHWRATTPGEHLIEVRAYDEKGAASTPANIVLRVSGDESEPMSAASPPQESASVPTATRSPAATTGASTATVPVCERDAKYVQDVTVPDDTRFVAGTKFDKTWRILNTGTCSWGSGYELVFVKGDQMGGPDQVAIPETNPEAEADVSVSFVAPDKPGTYSGYWRAKAPYGEQFGSSLFVKIVVVSPTATPEPTATATPRPAATPTPAVSD